MTCFQNNVSSNHNHVELTENEIKSLALLKSPVISQEEATKTVFNWIGDLQKEKNDSTIGLKKIAFTLPEIESIEALKPRNNYLAKQSSQSPVDTVPPAYLINFKNKQGFALTSADKRIANGGVLMYVPQGNLKHDDTLKPGMDIYISKLEGFVTKEKEKYKKREEHLESALTKVITTLPDSIKNKFSNDTLKFLKKQPIINQWTTIDSTIRNIGWTYFEGKGNLLLQIATRHQERIRNYKAPLLKVTWSQGRSDGKGGPYNDSTPRFGCGRSVTGCVATATAQIMSHYEQPENLHNTPLNWKNMKSNFNASYLNQQGKSDVARLMAWIGPQIGMNYGCSGSGVNTTETAANFLRQQGFHVGFGQSYNWVTVTESLNENKPIIIEGFTGVQSYENCTGPWYWRTCNTDYRGGGSGHAWVIDGYMQRWTRTQYSFDYYDEAKQKLDHVFYSRNYNYDVVDYYVHMNWGWGGYENGYFLSGVFNAKEEDVKTQVNYLPKKSAYDFKEFVTIWPSISH